MVRAAPPAAPRPPDVGPRVVTGSVEIATSQVSQKEHAHEFRNSHINPENVLYEKKGAIAYVTLNRPKVLNALNKATIAELNEVFEEVRDDAAVRGVILTGAGDKAFAAGADIGEMADDTPAEAEDKTRQGQRLHAHRKPRQAGHRGRQRLRPGRRLRAGDGLHDPTGRRDREVRPAGGDDRHHPGLRGNAAPAPAGRQGPALQLILTGDMIDAQEAYRIGLVNEVVPGDDLIPRAEAILNQIVANAPIAVKLAIEAVNKGLDVSLAEGLNIEASLFAQCVATEDKKEGAAAFREKRKPKFQGR